MSKLPEITLITTPHCKHCGTLIRALLPIAKQYHLKIKHLVAKKLLNDQSKVLLFENHQRVGFLPESYCVPEPRFPILICYFEPPVVIVGDMGASHLAKMIENMNLGAKDLEDIMAIESPSNIDEVARQYETMPGGSSIYSDIEIVKNNLL